jgi:hypothetical protein
MRCVILWLKIDSLIQSSKLWRSMTFLPSIQVLRHEIDDSTPVTIHIAYLAHSSLRLAVLVQ